VKERAVMNETSAGIRRMSPTFRSTLRQELAVWLDEGVVDHHQGAAISKRYGLDELGRGSSRLLVQALYLIGACLIGGGAISFVASRWGEIPVPLRIALLVCTLLACEITGFYLWKVRRTRKGLGEALILLGALVFGANVVLIAQMFHLHGEPHGAFGVWALGAAAIAYATMSGPCILVACVTSFVWFCGWTADNPHVFCWYPFVAVAACVPFLMRRSPAAFPGLILAAGLSIPVCAGFDSGEHWPTFLATAATPILLFGLGLWLDRHVSTRPMAATARVVGIAGVLLCAYAMSFHEGPAGELSKHPWRSDGWLWTIPLGVVCLAGIAVWGSVLRTPPERVDLRHRSIAVLLAGVLLISGTLTMQPVGLALGANLALGAVGVSLLYTAVRMHRRTSFWAGLLLLAFVVLSRFVEWDTHLLLKSLVFIAGGIGVIVGGIRFERHLKGKEPENG